MRKNKFQRNASKAREATERKRENNATRRANDISQAVAQSRGISTEFSLTQIWLVAGSYDNGDLNSMEVWWQSDAYKSTGCYNLLCDGFVPTNNDAKIGEGDDGNWWLDIWREGDELITAGYWPATLFTTLSSYEVLNRKTDVGQHTTTQMGSGHFSNEGYARASYISNIQIRSEPDGPYLNPYQIAMISSHLPTVKCEEFLFTTVGRATIPIVLEFLEFLNFYYGGPGDFLPNLAKDPARRTSSSVTLRLGTVPSGQSAVRLCGTTLLHPKGSLI
ncbi:hypothetical protein ACMD2_19339 [Ananas comosus]|uniref:Neprosin PEP catalytic domain-containing protein n=1 Tax=Ananas comosus TaxID=4615 RepID=A0A199V724_ANACO|nr:hypothetical protein ACMD2_19339 [Ananas comosus]